jgi:uncharacterized protein YjhX (UPF0386 family)
MKKTIALLILFAAICTHAYTGNYCDKEKYTCIQINPGGKAEIRTGGLNYTGSYTKTGDSFLVTANIKKPTDAASKNLIVEKVRNARTPSVQLIDSRTVWDRCYKEAESAAKRGVSFYGPLGGSSYESHEAARCGADADRKLQQLQQQREREGQQLRNLKYSDELLKEFMPIKYSLTLIGNTLHWPDGRCGSMLTLTKSGFKETAFNDFNKDKQFCVANVIYDKCSEETYNPEKQKCENNVLLSKCGDGWHNPAEQYCFKDTVKNKELTDSRDGKKYRTVEIGAQTWMAENLNYGCADCEKSGKVYNWKNAMKFCPSGWHLPSRKEWESFLAVKDDSLFRSTIGFWSATEIEDNRGRQIYFMSFNPKGIYYKFEEHNELLYVRCVQGAPDSKDIAKVSSDATKAPSNDVKTSAFKDQRDGKEYKSVKIGEQTWMAENLNYEVKGFLAKGTSKCYGNNSSNCASYGRLYDWEAALGACPKGWHLPSDEEWKQLTGSAGSNFSALPGGLYAVGRAGENGFYRLGEYGYWWTATPTANKNKSHQVGMNSGSHSFKHYTDDKACLLSVRCVQD